MNESVVTCPPAMGEGGGRGESLTLPRQPLRSLGESLRPEQVRLKGGSGCWGQTGRGAGVRAVGQDLSPDELPVTGLGGLLLWAYPLVPMHSLAASLSARPGPASERMRSRHSL